MAVKLQIVWNVKQHKAAVCGFHTPLLYLSYNPGNPVTNHFKLMLIEKSAKKHCSDYRDVLKSLSPFVLQVIFYGPDIKVTEIKKL